MVINKDLNYFTTQIMSAINSQSKSLLLLILISHFSISCQESSGNSSTTVESNLVASNDSIIDAKLLPEEVSFLFMGDFMMHITQINAGKDSTGNHDYNHYFDYTGSLINSVDFAIANLEVTLGGKPYTGYPQFCAPDEFAQAIKGAGIDILTTANNHSNDRRKPGLIRTIDYLDSLNIPHLGTYKDTTERESNYPMIIEKDGIKIALLNYTYGTNGLVTIAPNVVNMFDEQQMLADLQKSMDAEVDKIIAITHWGAEYHSYPDAFQKKWGEWLLENGADIVIGGHPHWVQPAELRVDSAGTEKLVIWSLGNIISNQRRAHTDGGSSLQFSLYRDSTGTVKLKDVGYHLHWVWVDTKNGDRKYHILPVTKAEKLSLDMDDQSLKQFNLFITNERTLYDDKNVRVPEFQYDLESDLYKLD